MHSQITIALQPIDFRINKHSGVWIKNRKLYFYAMTRIKKNKAPNLNPILFWDFDRSIMDFEKAYISIIVRIVERGDQHEINEIVRFYGHKKVITAVRDEISFLPNYAIDRALRFFPQLKKEEMCCYRNLKDNPYPWM